jgi:NADH-quinone oxidoreductase subunit J
MLNLGKAAQQQERAWLTGPVWVGPGLLAAVLLAELLWALSRGVLAGGAATGDVPPVAVGRALYGPYMLGVELASMILLAALVGAFHLGRRWQGQEKPRQEEASL